MITLDHRITDGMRITSPPPPLKKTSTKLRDFFYKITKMGENLGFLGFLWPVMPLTEGGGGGLYHLAKIYKNRTTYCTHATTATSSTISLPLALDSPPSKL
jgi:hypothetical protein